MSDTTDMHDGMVDHCPAIDADRAEDAARGYYGEPCESPHRTGMLCTLTVGHGGAHHAGGRDLNCYVSWTAP